MGRGGMETSTQERVFSEWESGTSVDNTKILRYVAYLSTRTLQPKKSILSSCWFLNPIFASLLFVSPISFVFFVSHSISHRSRQLFHVSGTPSACGGKAFSIEVLRMPIRIMDSAVYLGRTLAEIFSREAMR